MNTGRPAGTRATRAAVALRATSAGRHTDPDLVLSVFVRVYLWLCLTGN